MPRSARSSPSWATRRPPRRSRPPLQRRRPLRLPPPGRRRARQASVHGRGAALGRGPACLSCHSVAGVGALGGGALGPDLTGSYEKYGGAQGLGSSLEAMTFPTMAPIFAGKPLTVGERADLVAFLAAAPTQERTAGAAGKLIGLSVGLAVLIVLAALVFWRRRLTGVRRPLVSSAREG
ncbi:MAG: c-type cytochrome [Gaiella sp.]|nr:c-type cytochrome [Gaiella sp.]